MREKGAKRDSDKDIMRKVIINQKHCLLQTTISLQNITKKEMIKMIKIERQNKDKDVTIKKSYYLQTKRKK